MSLRIFHIVFISVSVALTLYLVGWGLRDFMMVHSIRGISMAVLGLVGGVLLIWYGIRVFHKLKELP
jgi:hypothetical protein